MGKIKLWEQEEDRILVEAANSSKSKKWRRASLLLHDRGFDRSEVECRERYINHLDPGVRKEVWSQTELETLYASYSEHGNKWFIIQKWLPGRTQTKIKNQFYGNVRLLLKTIARICLKANCGFVNDIRTDALLHIYDGTGSFEGQTLVKNTLEQLRYQVDKRNCETLIGKNYQDYQALAHKLVRLYWHNTQSEGSKLPSGLAVKQDTSSASGVWESPGNGVKVDVVNTVNGRVTDLNKELNYVMGQIEKHKQMMERYQEQYRRLLEQEQPDNFPEGKPSLIKT